MVRSAIHRTVVICCVIFTCTIVSLRSVFRWNGLRRPFSGDVLFNQETVDFYWMVVCCGVRCLSILNVVFAIILRSPSYISRLKPPDTRKQLRRAALTNDEGEFGNRNHQGLEMLEANPLEFTPDVERKHGWIHLCYHLMKKTNLSITMKFPQDHDS
ncbi:BnaA03g52180D [Brassica napus]|uniref:BnaA03g52180D protein n=1 Tax=Brassica napus TaxID=3708 RepID=A0A078FGB9_BRANA|nr:BnaA03g52180D [Brassica napus]